MSLTISADTARSTCVGVRATARVLAAVLGTAAFWMFLIWAVHRESPRTLVSFHGFIHAAIAEKFLDPSSVTFPPENPFFAGRPVPYYWFFQFLAAQLTRLFGWNIFYSLEAVILAATGVLMIFAVALGYILFRSTVAGVLMGYLVVAGTNPFGFIVAGLKIFLQGTQLLQDSPDYLWGVVHPLYGLIRYNDIGGLYGPLLNFFLNNTSRPVALAALMFLLFSLRWALSSGRVFPRLLLACASALTTALSPIIGISVGGALLVGLLGCWLWQTRCRARRPVASLPSVIASVAIVAGILIAAPTYYHLVFRPSDSRPEFWLLSMAGLRHFVAVMLSISPLMILALFGLRHIPEEHQPFVGMLFIAALVLLGANVAFVLPSWNQSNFFHAAVIFLSVPAAASILCAGPAKEHFVASPRWTAGLVLTFLPTLLLLLAAYINRPALPAAFQGTNLVRLPQDSDLARFYRWVQNQTHRDAIFVVDPRRRVTMVGNISEFPVMMGRAIFTEDPHHYMVEPYPDAGKRFDVAVRLVSGSGLNSSEQAYLRDLKRPVFVVSYHSMDNSLVNRMVSVHGLPVFRHGTISVFKWSAPST